jgi:hypothetical protein
LLLKSYILRAGHLYNTLPEQPGSTVCGRSVFLTRNVVIE